MGASGFVREPLSDAGQVAHWIRRSVGACTGSIEEPCAGGMQEALGERRRRTGAKATSGGADGPEEVTLAETVPGRLRTIYDVWDLMWGRFQDPRPGAAASRLVK